MSYEELLYKLKNDLPLESLPDSFVTTLLKLMPQWLLWGLVVLGIVLAVIFLFMLIDPIYSVWASKKRGQAALAEANYAEQVAIAEATARLNSAEMNKSAELIDAAAVAESITIIGTGLEKNESYLRWQWIKSLAETSNEVIYVPTEANLPILEASKRSM